MNDNSNKNELVINDFVVSKDVFIKNILKKSIIIFIVAILSMLLIIFSIIEIIQITNPSENVLPIIDEPTDIIEEQKPEETVDPKEELNKLFSEDVDFEKVRKENNNNEIVGRIEIPNVFNLLLTQTKNNDYYLDYNIKRKRTDKGTEFIDFRNKFTDNQINIYGHNSRLYDLPFKNIEKFLDEDFFNNNQYILFQHPEGRRIYQIAALSKETPDNEHMLMYAKDHKKHIDKLLANPIITRNLEYDENTNIIILQTCIRQQDGHYYILVGFEVE